MTRAFAVLLVSAFAAMCLCLAPARALAQAAPEGNARPAPQQVNRDGTFENPFGNPTPNVPDASVAEKLAFAAAVDLEPLRSLALFHNGRVKIFDTLARESVRTITGAAKFSDLEPMPSSDADPSGRTIYRKHKMDPLFTLLDLIIDPRYYFDKPLLGIDYLPLREAFVEQEYPKDKDAQERALRLLRISPKSVVTHVNPIADKFAAEQPYRVAIDKLGDAVALWRDSSQNLVMVAPSARDQSWTHLATLPESHPARKAAADLGAAWRARDAAAVSAAVRALADELPKINAATYPTSARSLEVAYNRSNAFEWGFWAYFLSLVTLLLAFGTGRNWLAILGSVFFVAAIGLHAFGFVARCLIAERFAIQNQFESMTGLSLFAALVGLGIMIVKRQWLFGAAAAATGFLVLITATQTNIPGKFIEREAAILNTSVLLKYHVTTVLVSYGLITLGFIVSLFYLGVHYIGSSTLSAAALGASAAPTSATALPDSESATGRARTLGDLDRAQMTILQLAFWTLGVGILLGAWWADHSWGRWWAFDPKETWALLTWIIYLITIHTRFAAGGNKALVTAWLSVVGFFVMLWTYFGVNLLLPGLHAYA